MNSDRESQYEDVIELSDDVDEIDREATDGALNNLELNEVFEHIPRGEGAGMRRITRGRRTSP